MNNGKSYIPHKAQERILDLAYSFVASVSYTVTLRWLFYRLLQAGIYHGKDDYHQTFLSLITRARKGFYKEWRPDTLADDTRESILGGLGPNTPLEWLEQRVCRLGCKLDRWNDQPNYVELWFEAAAMRSQFEYYTHHITLRPFGGDPSLAFKMDIAMHLKEVVKWYPGHPIVILYFGDMDPKGLQIPLSAAADVREWSGVEFEFIRCGLNPGDETRFDLSENIDKPGCYQWEALGDDHARELIVGAIERYVDRAIMENVALDEKRATERFQRDIGQLLRQWEADPTG